MSQSSSASEPLPVSASIRGRPRISPGAPGYQTSAARATDPDLDRLLYDPSGLHRETYFHRRLASEFLRAVRYRLPLGLVWLELAGLSEGAEHEERLAHFARVLLKVGRAPDIGGRVQGSQVAVLLPSTGARGSRIFVKRLRDAVAVEEGLEGLSLSAGWSALPDAAIDSPDAMLFRARRALMPADELPEDHFPRSRSTAVTMMVDDLPSEVESRDWGDSYVFDDSPID